MKNHLLFGACVILGAAVNAWLGWVPLEDGMRYASGMFAGYVMRFALERGWV